MTKILVLFHNVYTLFLSLLNVVSFLSIEVRYYIHWLRWVWDWWLGFCSFRNVFLIKQYKLVLLCTLYAESISLFNHVKIVYFPTTWKILMLDYYKLCKFILFYQKRILGGVGLWPLVLKLVFASVSGCWKVWSPTKMGFLK